MAPNRALVVVKRCESGRAHPDLEADTRSVRNEKENIMNTFRTLSTRALLLAAPLAFLVLETAGKLHP